MTVIWGVVFILPCQAAFAQSNDNNRHVWTVVIDPGHGGNDPGAVSGGVREKDLVLDVGLRLGKKIRDAYPDVKVIYTRSTDVFIPLYARADIANRNKADLFISLHANWVKESVARGTETFTLGLHKSQENLEVAMKENSVILLEEDYSANYEGFNPDEAESYIMFENMQAEYQTQSIDLAARVQDEFTSNLKLINRGVKQAGFLVLKQSTMPAVLVEMGFISNPAERNFLISAAGKEKVAESVFKAFSTYKKTIDSKSIFTLATSAGNTDSPVNAKNSSDKTTNTTVETADIPAKATDTADKDSDSQTRTTNPQPRATGSQPKTAENQATTVNSQETPAKKQVNATDAKYYSVQIGAINKEIPATPANFKGVTNVHRLFVKPYHKYYTGKFSTFNEAKAEKNRLSKKFPGAFVVVIRDGIPTPLYNGDLPN